MAPSKLTQEPLQIYLPVALAAKKAPVGSADWPSVAVWVTRCSGETSPGPDSRAALALGMSPVTFPDPRCLVGRLPTLVVAATILWLEVRSLPSL